MLYHVIENNFQFTFAITQPYRNRPLESDLGIKIARTDT